MRRTYTACTHSAYSGQCIHTLLSRPCMHTACTTVHKPCVTHHCETLPFTGGPHREGQGAWPSPDGGQAQGAWLRVRARRGVVGDCRARRQARHRPKPAVLRQDGQALPGGAGVNHQRAPESTPEKREEHFAGCFLWSGCGSVAGRACSRLPRLLFFSFKSVTRLTETTRISHFPNPFLIFSFLTLSLSLFSPFFCCFLQPLARVSAPTTPSKRGHGLHYPLAWRWGACVLALLS